MGVLRSEPANWITHSLSNDEDSTEDGIPVRTVTLDEVFEVNEIGTCNLLKLDCEGSEYEILASAGPSTMDRVERVVGEYHCTPRFPTCEHAEAELRSLLNRDFSVVDIVREHPVDATGGVFFAAR